MEGVGEVWGGPGFGHRSTILEEIRRSSRFIEGENFLASPRQNTGLANTSSPTGSSQCCQPQHRAKL
ncbi:hypothetical protein EVAR_28585_1 [Eumeta japonica]|uniref:Uncharacterized protein n=1 Tax=Eumeta variegata TaxID=151549 RepID=A0A4C1UWR6_EUMVA|nr:hypothetical protein EVAR_28585_1 [Eumeta japonica]